MAFHETELLVSGIWKWLIYLAMYEDYFLSYMQRIIKYERYGFCGNYKLIGKEYIHPI